MIPLPPPTPMTPSVMHAFSSSPRRPERAAALPIVRRSRALVLAAADPLMPPTTVRPSSSAPLLPVRPAGAPCQA
jgi:hypothetical protein